MMKHACVSVVTLLALAGAASAQLTGPSSSQSPYVLPTVGGVTTTSIFTVGDTVGGYRMVGIPDGLGAFNNAGSNTFTLAMSHELGNTAGVTRAHGSTGAFVSRWEIDRTSLAVNSGRDHNTAPTDVNLWNGAGYTPGTTQFNRFCSSDLAPVSAFSYNGLGTTNRIFLNGEESGPEGRAFAHILTGPNTNATYQLPHLGRFSWENAVANPYAQTRTVVMGTDDTSDNGGVYMYVGTRTDTGNDIERAGLTNGNLYGITVEASQTEVRAGNFTSSRFGTYNHGDVSNTTGASLNFASVANNVFNWLRPEDGAWDPRAGHQNDFYFVTTDRFNNAPGSPGHSRLWRMAFDDITNPAAGGTVTMLLDGSVSGFNMLDNLTIDTHGRILMQEDPGSTNYLAGIFLYDIATGGFGQIAQQDPSRFLTGSANFLTIDEESSGIIDAIDILGDGWFLLDTQAHYNIPGELVQGGQLMAMYVPTNIVPTPAAAAVGLLGLGAMAGRRRR